VLDFIQTLGPLIPGLNLGTGIWKVSAQLQRQADILAASCTVVVNSEIVQDLHPYCKRSQSLATASGEFQSVIGQTRRFSTDPNWFKDTKSYSEQSSMEAVAVQTAGAKFAELMVGASTGRRICITEKGYIGLVPPYSQEGDTVAIVFRAQLPFVLREVNRGNGSRRLQLVGEYYVHGAMDGERISSNAEHLAFELV
jgi:hypothetical protein